MDVRDNASLARAKVRDGKRRNLPRLVFQPAFSRAGVACCAPAVSRFSRAVLFGPSLTCLPIILASSGFRRRHVFIPRAMEPMMGFLRVCLAVTPVVLALAAVRRLLGGRSGCADGGRRCGCSGGRRLAQHRRGRIRPGAARYVFGDELKPGEMRVGSRPFAAQNRRDGVNCHKHTNGSWAPDPQHEP